MSAALELLSFDEYRHIGTVCRAHVQFEEATVAERKEIESVKISQSHWLELH